MPLFTTDSILLYLHNELPQEQLAAFEQCLENDWAMQEKLQIFASIENNLVLHSLENPSSKTIAEIMAKAYKKPEKLTY